jgi:hypothetical protein
MNLADCVVMNVPKVADPRGNLSVIESGQTIPFEFKRMFYLYDVPGGETRAGHANIKLQQFIIAASGSFDVVLDDAFDRKVFSLNRSYYGLYIPGMIWREITNFSSGAVCIVLASAHYDAADYYRDYDAFKAAAQASRRTL